MAADAITNKQPVIQNPMLHTKRIFAFMSLLLAVTLAMAQGPNDTGTYYKSANGTKGKALKTALSKIIDTKTVISYDGLLNCYKSTDRRADGKVWDMYSCTTNFSFGDYNSQYKGEGDSYNREHSMPQSWFKKASPMKSDLMHVVPTDGYVNNRRSNYPFGETNYPTYQSNQGFSKVGPCSLPGYSGTVFEPNDEYKGDFARIYFYMATRYESRIASWSSDMLAGNSYPAFKPWVVEMLLRWAKEDPVSQKEIDRNNAVYGYQHNRNPYVDYPGLEQYVWGDKQDVAFDYSNFDGTNPSPDPDPDPKPDPDPDPDPTPDPTPDPDDGTQVFVKVSATSQLRAGDKYILVYEGKSGDDAVALADISKDVRSGASVSISTDGTIKTEVDAKGKPRQLMLGGEEKAYTLYVIADKTYLSLTSNNNKLSNASDTKLPTAKWDISIGSTGAVITNSSFATRYIRYNISSPRFACYTSSTGNMGDVWLYRNDTATSGIDGIADDDSQALVNVYTTTGITVRRNVKAADALSGLPSGIYIVGHRKVVVQ